MAENAENAEGVDSSKYTVQVVTKYMCRYCARQFDSPTEMQNHISTHAKEKAPHTCYVCGKMYRTPSKLQRHVRVHSGERPYACNICGRRFTRSDHVKQHMKVHMPQKQRNTCKLCNTKFMRRQTLHNHLQQNHGISQVYTCHRCGEAFETVDQLHQHKESHTSLVLDSSELFIKREPGMSDDNPTEGLATFSLGPQPQVNEDVSGRYTPAASTSFATNGDLDSGLENSLIGEPSIAERIANDQIPVSSKMSIAACFSLTGSGEGANMNSEEFENLKKTTVTDGMRMFVVPDKDKETGMEMEDCNSDDEDKMHIMEEGDSNESKENDEDNNGDVSNTLTPSASPNTSKSLSPTSTETQSAGVKSETLEDESGQTMPSLKLRLSNAYKATPKIIVGPQYARSLAYTKSNSNVVNAPQKTMQYKLLPAITTGTAPYNNNQATLPVNMYGKRMTRCEYCGIWFEDYAMSLLHNSLHAADDTDPFTCRKCLKKLGNRLEFMAHLVWHLEPDFN